jgi:hypothetical protein
MNKIDLAHCAAIAALALSPFAAPAYADVGNFRCTFQSDPRVTLDISVVSDTRVEITYPNGVRVPYGAEGAGNVLRWQSNHAPAVRFEIDTSRRLAWARVPIATPVALSADAPFNPRIRRSSVVPIAPPATLQAYHLYSAYCAVLP